MEPYKAPGVPTKVMEWRENAISTWVDEGRHSTHLLRCCCLSEEDRISCAKRHAECKEAAQRARRLDGPPPTPRPKPMKPVPLPGPRVPVPPCNHCGLLPPYPSAAQEEKAGRKHYLLHHSKGKLHRVAKKLSSPFSGGKKGKAPEEEGGNGKEDDGYATLETSMYSFLPHLDSESGSSVSDDGPSDSPAGKGKKPGIEAIRAHFAKLRRLERASALLANGSPPRASIRNRPRSDNLDK